MQKLYQKVHIINSFILQKIFFLLTFIVFYFLGKVFPKSRGTVNRANTFEELHARLDVLKNTKKLEYKDKQLKKNLKNRMKKMSKREERLIQKKLVKTEQNAAGLSKIKKEDGEIPKIPRPKPIFNSEGKMVFSKFDFSEIGTKKKPPKNGADPKKMLLQLKQKREKLNVMEESGEVEKVQEIKEKEAWKSVLAKASGEKVSKKIFKRAYYIIYNSNGTCKILHRRTVTGEK